mmetsp:Transcript_115640/g.172811  ORF Transcript_115640/g.172811 Transcript_115640/m.172811 type:complete len:212 (-) Transcript_115640:237-872(-)
MHRTLQMLCALPMQPTLGGTTAGTTRMFPSRSCMISESLFGAACLAHGRVESPGGFCQENFHWRRQSCITHARSKFRSFAIFRPAILRQLRSQSLWLRKRNSRLMVIWRRSQNATRRQLPSHPLSPLLNQRRLNSRSWLLKLLAWSLLLFHMVGLSKSASLREQSQRKRSGLSLSPPQINPTTMSFSSWTRFGGRGKAETPRVGRPRLKRI